MSRQKDTALDYAMNKVFTSYILISLSAALLSSILNDEPVPSFSDAELIHPSNSEEVSQN